MADNQADQTAGSAFCLPGRAFGATIRAPRR
jgi:hypothetical protein